MTIRARIPQQTQEVQPTQAFNLFQGLADRLRNEQQLNVPRSKAAWGAEESRLGSWNTGVGRVYASGVGRQYASGKGRPSIGDFDPEEASKDEEYPR